MLTAAIGVVCFLVGLQFASWLARREARDVQSRHEARVDSLTATIASQQALHRTAIEDERGAWRAELEKARGIDADERKRILADAAAERVKLQEAMEVQRKDAAAERDKLISRIQAYDPNPEDAPKKPADPNGLQPAQNADQPKVWTEDEIRRSGLVQTPDGWYDPRTKAMYETPDDWRFYMADLKKRGYLEPLNPGVVEEEGYAVALDEARKRVATEKAAAAARVGAAKAALSGAKAPEGGV